MMLVNVINLDRSADRMTRFQSINSHLDNISRFRAIDGRTLDLNALIRERLIQKDVLSAYTVGALGCAMSHLALWDQAIAREAVLTVAEDDAVFNKHFSEDAGLLLKDLDPAWDMVLWGWNFSHLLFFDALPGVSGCAAYFNENDMRKGIDAFQNQIISPRLFRLYRAFGLVCYSISPKGARALRERCVPLRDGSVPFPDSPRPYRNTGIDVMMNGFYGSLDCYVSVPPLVITSNDSADSTIQTEANT